MSIKRLIATTAVALFLSASGPAFAAAPAAMSISAAFDEKIGAAKVAMMADPKAAYDISTTALGMVKSVPTAQQNVASATAMWLQGEALNRMNELKKAEPILDAALMIAAKESPNTKLHGDLMLAQGSNMGIQGKVQEALADYQRAYEVFRKAGEARSQAKALQEIGSIYLDAGDFKRVLKYYALSAEAYADDPVLLMTAHNNKANAYRQLGRLQESEAEYRAALAQARDLKSPSLEARILTNLAAAEVAAGHLDAADGDLERGLAVAARDPAAKEWIPFLWGVSAQSAQKRGQFEIAAKRLDRTFAGVDVKTTDLPFRDFHESAYQVYAKLGRSDLALAHLEAYKRLDDDARTLMVSTNAALMAAQFDFANQDLKISKLNSAKLEQDIKLAKTRSTLLTLVLVGISVVLALLLVGMISLRRSRDRERVANTNLSAANSSLGKALKAKSEFLATTSHEIRTPLNGILGMTQVLLADKTVTPSVLERIKLLDSAGNTMRVLVDDLLDVAKIEQGGVAVERDTVDVPALLEATVALSRDQAALKGLSLDLDIGDVPAFITEDGGRLRQIILNLLGNAVKFTEAGEIKLTGSVEAIGADEWLVLKVADTGIGIPNDMLEEIFESFRQVESSTTRRFEGTGLGLTICRSLAEALGGTIAVESVLDQGSTFTLRLPLVRAAAPVAAAAASQPGRPSGLAGCSVLLIEANPLNQAMIRAVLQPQVLALEMVSSHAAALEALAQRAYDIVVAEAGAAGQADLAFDQAMGTLRAQAQGAVMSVILPAADPDMDVRLRQAGIALVLVKPISPLGMVDALRTVCDLEVSDSPPQFRADFRASA